MGYVTLADVKSVSGMSSTDATRDDLLNYAINAATKLIDNETGRKFTLDTSATARTFTPNAFEDVLILDDIGSTTGLVVETGSFGSTTWDTLASTDYEVSPVNAIAKGKPITGLYRPTGWGYSPYVRVRVTAKWGWPSIPDEVVQACLIQALRLFKRKDSAEGVLGSTDFGFSRVSKADPDVRNLIAHLVIPGFGE